MVEPRFDRGRYVLDWGAGRIEIDPVTGGRITALRLGGRNLLTGPDVDPANYGSTFWPSPQAVWGWPPVPEIDHAPYEVASEGPNALTLRGATSPVLGLSVDKRFVADRRPHGGAPDLHDSQPRQRAGRGRALADHARAGRGADVLPDGRGDLPPSNLAVREQALGVTWYAFDAAAMTEHQKLFADGARGLAGARRCDGTLLVKTFAVARAPSRRPARRRSRSTRRPRTPTSRSRPKGRTRRSRPAAPGLAGRLARGQAAAGDRAVARQRAAARRSSAAGRADRAAAAPPPTRGTVFVQRVRFQRICVRRVRRGGVARGPSALPRGCTRTRPRTRRAGARAPRELGRRPRGAARGAGGAGRHATSERRSWHAAGRPALPAGFVGSVSHKREARGGAGAPPPTAAPHAGHRRRDPAPDAADIASRVLTPAERRRSRRWTRRRAPPRCCSASPPRRRSTRRSIRGCGASSAFKEAQIATRPTAAATARWRWRAARGRFRVSSTTPAPTAW